MSTCKSNGSITLFELQKQYARKQLSTPDWQRSDVWSDKKKREFFRVVKEKGSSGTDTLPGCVIVYSTKDNPTVQKISDGFQRTLNSQAFFEILKTEQGEAEAENILSNVRITQLIMEYRDEDEARADFLLINNGTSLTPAEQTRTVLTQLDNFSLWETNVFAPLHRHVREAIGSAGIKIKGTAKAKSLADRGDLALFLRYLTAEKDCITYDTNVGENLLNESTRSRLLEAQVVTTFQKEGLEKVEGALRSFKTQVESYVNHTMERWNKLDKSDWASEIKVPTPTCVRFLLHVHLWRKNNGTPLEAVEAFVDRLLFQSRGATSIPKHNGRPTIFSAEDLARLPNLWKKVEAPEPPVRVRKRTAQLPPGTHNAHVNAHAGTSGSDETVALSALKNLSIGTRTLEDLGSSQLNEDLGSSQLSLVLKDDVLVEEI